MTISTATNYDMSDNLRNYTSNAMTPIHIIIIALISLNITISLETSVRLKDS